MRIPPLTTGALTAAVVCIGLAACGGSSSMSSSGGGGSSSSGSTPTAAISLPGGSDFCTQAKSFQSQLSQFTKGLTGLSPGATPSLTAYQQLVAAVAGAVDSLDGSAPSEIASSVHTLRTAYDQINTKVQSATTFQEVSADFAAFDTQAVKDASAQITAYGKNTCGITSSP